MLKIRESFMDRAEKRVTEEPTYNKFVYDFTKAMHLPILAMNVPAVEQIEGCGIDYLLVLGIGVNQWHKGVGTYDGSQQGSCKERPACFYVAAVQGWINNIPHYLKEMANTKAIKAYERHSESSDIRTFATKSQKPSNVTIVSGKNPDKTSNETSATSSAKSEGASEESEEGLTEVHELNEFVFEHHNPAVLNRLIKFHSDDKLFDCAHSNIGLLKNALQDDKSKVRKDGRVGWQRRRRRWLVSSVFSRGGKQ